MVIFPGQPVLTLSLHPRAEAKPILAISELLPPATTPDVNDYSFNSVMRTTTHEYFVFLLAFFRIFQNF